MDRERAQAIYDELTAPLAVIEDKDPSEVTEAEWKAAANAHCELIALGLASRRGQLG